MKIPANLFIVWTIFFAGVLSAGWFYFKGFPVIMEHNGKEDCLIDLEQAERKALDFIAKEFGKEHEYVLLQDATRHESFGWVFFYTTAKYAETGDPSYLVPGNAPVIIDCLGNLVVTGTSRNIEYYIEEYKNKFNSRKTE